MSIISQSKALRTKARDHIVQTRSGRDKMDLACAVSRPEKGLELYVLLYHNIDHSHPVNFCSFLGAVIGQLTQITRLQEFVKRSTEEIDEYLGLKQVSSTLLTASFSNFAYVPLEYLVPLRNKNPTHKAMHKDFMSSERRLFRMRAIYPSPHVNYMSFRASTSVLLMYSPLEMTNLVP